MALKAGVFKMEQQAIEAVQALEAEGFSKNDIKVFAKNTEDTRRIESETDVHADEIEELTETRNNTGYDSGFGIPGIAATPLGAAAGISYAGSVAGFSNASPYFGAGVLAVSGLLVDDSDMERSLLALGLDEETAGACRNAVAEGGIVVAADIGDAKASSGGPDLTSGGTAEAVFRRCGAERIL